MIKHAGRIGRVRRLKHWCGLVFLSLCTTWAGAQQTQTQQFPEQGFGAMPAPKDARTRARAHTELGSLYFQDGNLIVALEELTLAAAADPNYAPAFSTRGLVLYYVKEFDSAEKDFKRALSLEERNPDINNNYGWFLCQTDRAKESIAYFERAYRNPLYQTPASAYLNAGECYVKLNELDLAEDALRRAQRLSPDNPRIFFHLAEVSYKRRNFDAARKQLSDAMRVLAEPGPEMLWLRVRVERRLGNSSEENSLVSQLRRKFPESPEYQELLKGNFE